MSLDISKTNTSNMAGAVEDVTVDTMNTDGLSDQDETTYQNPDWSQQWGYFNEISDLHSALLMKAIWDTGKGYICEDTDTEAILEHISGMGKDTFKDILFNMDVVRFISGDSYAEIIRDKETNTLINLKPLDPSTIKIVVGKDGIIKRYEQTQKIGAKTNIVKFKPEEIFHLSYNRLADQLHGISVIKALETTILADNESFKDIKSLMHHQAKPFIMWKLKTDDEARISDIISKIDNARNKSEDLFIPDDEDIISYEVVQINPATITLEWRTEMRNKFYRALGLPLIIFGSGGSTESGGKMEYLAHEQVFENSQKYLEDQIWNQLYLRVNLVPPTSLLENLQTDQAKDANQGLEMQPNDLTAGEGR